MLKSTIPRIMAIRVDKCTNDRIQIYQWRARIKAASLVCDRLRNTSYKSADLVSSQKVASVLSVPLLKFRKSRCHRLHHDKADH